MSTAQEVMARVVRERHTSADVRSMDVDEVVAWIHRLEDEIERLRSLVPDAFEEGWYAGRNTTSVVGYIPEHVAIDLAAKLNSGEVVL